MYLATEKHNIAKEKYTQHFFLKILIGLVVFFLQIISFTNNVNFDIKGLIDDLVTRGFNNLPL